VAGEGLQLLAQGVITVAVEVEEAEVAEDLELLADYVRGVGANLQISKVGCWHRRSCTSFRSESVRKWIHCEKRVPNGKA